MMQPVAERLLNAVSRGLLDEFRDLFIYQGRLSGSVSRTEFAAARRGLQ